MVTPQSQNLRRIPQKRFSQWPTIRCQMVYFYVLCSKNILMKAVGYQQSTCLCVKMEFMVGTFHFHANCIHFRRAVFVHVGLAQLLAQNIRQSSTRV